MRNLYWISLQVPNILGFTLGVIQLLLYGIYRNAKPIVVDEEKKVPEQVINIVVLGNSEVHPIDSESDKTTASDHEVEEEEEEKKKNEKENEKYLGVATAVPEEYCGGNATVQIDTAPVLVMCAA